MPKDLYEMKLSFYCSLSLTLLSIFTTDAVEIDADNIQPFYSPGDAEKSGCFAPDIMLPDEREAFPELVK